MDYELAKQLEDAGYDYPWVEKASFLDGQKTIYYYYPTLSELIEACGEVTLCGYKNSWEAYSTSAPHIDSSYKSSTGKTPEEAVARLWLALNKK